MFQIMWLCTGRWLSPWVSWSFISVLCSKGTAQVKSREGTWGVVWFWRLTVKAKTCCLRQSNSDEANSAPSQCASDCGEAASEPGPIKKDVSPKMRGLDETLLIFQASSR